jgi:hypothetical protein
MLLRLKPILIMLMSVVKQYLNRSFSGGGSQLDSMMKAAENNEAVRAHSYSKRNKVGNGNRLDIS